MMTPEPIQFAAEGPQPLLRDLRAAEPFPVAALGPLREVAEAIQGATQAPIAIPAASALSIASLAVQGFADVQLLHEGLSPVSLYMLTIAQSGERKSSCDRPLMAALREHERTEGEAYASALSRCRLDRDAYDERKKAALRGLSHEKDGKRIEAQALAALGEEPKGPIQPYRTASEPTLEGLFRAFLEGLPSLGLFSDEAGQFLGGFGMSKDHRTKTLSGLNLLWDGAPLDRMRAMDGASKLYGRRLSLHLMAQPVVMHEFLSDPVASGLGFLPRCLICEPQSTIGQRLSHNARTDTPAVLAFETRLKKTFKQAMPMWEDGRSLKPRVLLLDAPAREILTCFADTVERDQAPGRRLAGITGTASKAAEQAARLAAVLTLWADLDAPNVGAEAMAWGIELAQFYLGEAERLASAGNVPDDIMQAENLKNWLLSSWPHPDITSGEITQSGPYRIRNGRAAKATALTLQGFGWLVALPPGSVVRGKARKQAWRIVRRV